MPIIKVLKNPISRGELSQVAKEGFGDLVKAAVDIEQEMMAVGGELHADEEAELVEKHGAKRENIWGINMYPQKQNEEWIEFDSMINLKPMHGNRSRGVDDMKIQERIKKVVAKLVSG